MTRPGLLTILLSLAFFPLAPIAAQTPLWTRQLGTPDSDIGFGVAVDGAGNSYVTGRTYGSLGGPNAGSVDAFLTRYDASGTLLWTRQTGTATYDLATCVTVDGAGNAYIAGYTYGNFGGPNAGGWDAFLVKYDVSGTLLWTRQVGTTADDIAYGLAVDGTGNVYMVGRTEGSLGGSNAGGVDAFLAKYDASGALLWARQIGTTAYDLAYGVAVDGAGNAFMTGSTSGSLGGSTAGINDAFLVKYNESGALLWKRQIGTPSIDYAQSVAVDGAGNPYITGYTFGSLGGPNAGFYDAFLAKYDASGILLWTCQSGTNEDDYAYGVAVDSVGNAYITGHTYGSLDGTNAGSVDVFLSKYDASGTLLWTRQTGTPEGDGSFSVAMDGAGNTYITGYTQGSLGGTNAGNTDVFLSKFGPPPCPSDFDGDGFVTGDDFAAYVAAFEAGTAGADFDRDTFVTGEDFDAYVAAFEAGC